MNDERTEQSTLKIIPKTKRVIKTAKTEDINKYGIILDRY
jgi:hypothetical protein